MENEVIVELLGEGGSRALYGVPDGESWLFSRRGPISARSIEVARKWKGIVAGWAAALAELDEFGPWYELAPSNVHRDFAIALLAAVRERGASNRALGRWEAACELAKTSLPVKTIKAVHASDAWLYFDDPDVPEEARQAWLASQKQSDVE